ncbi:MAG: 16S rRNA (cytidine(1402)-2'-O)-methyltransferase [Candidatus Promineifilaceae bacterium]
MDSETNQLPNYLITQSPSPMPVLYLVGTPIGNLEDITLRALRILKEVALIAAEDTRTTGRLLHHYDIKTPLTSYHEYTKPERIEQLVAQLASEDVALVSDAGMPGLSDPGYRLVKAALEQGIKVVPIPGPSAAVSALISSGLPTDSFLFLGFLPRQKKARRTALSDVASLPYTLVFYEAPHRLLASLAAMTDVLGNRQIVVGRELTKLYEEIWRGKISEAADYFGQDQVRGEITVVVAGAEESEQQWDEERIKAAVHQALEQGLSRKDTAAKIAQQSGWRKRDVYNLILNLS